MHFGEPVDEERLAALLRPGDGIATVLTADVYGSGAADELLGRALEGVERDSCCVIGAVGHDFVAGERDGPRGFPRFTDPALRGPAEYADYLRAATEASLERVGISAFDVLLLHNPDRTGFTSESVWDGMAALVDAGLTGTIGVAPGPANGFTLDLIDCFERFGDRIDWAMVILNPLEPWPGELCLAAAGGERRARDHPRGRLRRPVLGRRAAAATSSTEHDHRRFRPDGWVEAGPREARPDAPDRRRRGVDPDPARLPVEPRPRPGRLRGADADPGGRHAGARPIEDKRARAGGPPDPAPRRRAASTRSARSATTAAR